MNCWRILAALIVLAGAALSAQAQASGEKVVGNWRAASGSVLTVYACGKDVYCVKLYDIRKDRATVLDDKNPDANLRSRSLCGLQIGQGFKMEDATHAEDGKLYDPQSGKTYSGAMTLEGDQLHARGYIGFKLFGRSETWTRASGPSVRCAKQ